MHKAPHVALEGIENRRQDTARCIRKESAAVCRNEGKGIHASKSGRKRVLGHQEQLNADYNEGKHPWIRQARLYTDLQLSAGGEELVGFSPPKTPVIYVALEKDTGPFFVTFVPAAIARPSVK